MRNSICWCDAHEKNYLQKVFGDINNFCDLYQRLVSFFDDNLLTANTLSHHGERILVDEELSPSRWLQRVHEGLPSLIKQRYGAELRNKTLASIKPEISQALDSLLDELRSTEDAKVMRTHMGTPTQHSNKKSFLSRRNHKYCCLCRTANRTGYDTHYLPQCKFLPEGDRRMMKVRQVGTFDDDIPEEPSQEHEILHDPYFDDQPPPQSRRVTTHPSPHLDCFYRHYPVQNPISSAKSFGLLAYISF